MEITFEGKCGKLEKFFTDYAVIIGSMTYVTMMLKYAEGRWLADFIGLEK